MSILIKGMEMPTCCGYCPFEYKKYCMAKPSLMVESGDRHPRCPLVELPPHGRLIDANTLTVNHGWLDNFDNTHTHIQFVYANEINSTPTIIESEKEITDD